MAHRHSDWAGADDQDGHVHGDFPVSSDLGVKASLCSSSRPILAERRRFERVNSVVFHNENLSASLGLRTRTLRRACSHYR